MTKSESNLKSEIRNRIGAPGHSGFGLRISVRISAFRPSDFCCCCSHSTTFAQPLSNLVFTAGTTIQDTNLNNWSYVLLGAPEPQLLAGKRFDVFSKTGFPTNSGTFTLRGTIFQQTAPTAINALLTQSVALGDNLTALDNSLNILLHKVPGATNQTLPQKVLTAFQTAATDPGTASALLILERLHPGLTRCAGQAFAETIHHHDHLRSPRRGSKHRRRRRSGWPRHHHSGPAGDFARARDFRSRSSPTRRAITCASACAGARPTRCAGCRCCNSASTSGVCRRPPPSPTVSTSRRQRPRSFIRQLTVSRG